MYDCYDKIISLSNSDCSCLETDRPADYNESTSGLSLDGLAPISSLVSLAECDKTLWDILEQARDNGVKRVVTDSNALLGKKYTLRRPNAKSQVLGQIKAKDSVDPDKNYGVVRVVCAPVRGGLMRLKRIGSIFNAVGTVQVALYDNVSGLLETYDVPTGANTHQILTLPTAKELPLYSKYVEELEYYFVYLFDGANLPKDNEISCGCGNWSPIFDTSSPYYYNIGQHKSAPWADYIMIGGGEVNSVSELEDMPGLMPNNMYGLTLELDFGCKVDEVLCEESLDFVSNPLAMSLAFAVQYATGVEVAEKILKSPLLSRENMIGSEDWEESIIIWQEKYNEHINYIVENADYTSNDCLTCKDLLEMTRQGLFA